MRPQNLYEVAVGNIGVVHTGNVRAEARAVYNGYVKKSRSGEGRGAYEGVTLFKNSEVLVAYDPPSASLQIHKWLARNPHQALYIAHAALAALYVDEHNKLRTDRVSDDVEFVNFLTTIAKARGFDKVLKQIKETAIRD